MHWRRPAAGCGGGPLCSATVATNSMVNRVGTFGLRMRELTGMPLLAIAGAGARGSSAPRPR